MFRSAFPDFHMTIEDLIAEEDIVVAFFTQGGTHRRTFMGASPTGRQVQFTEIGILRVAGGKVVERWFEPDMLGLLPATWPRCATDIATRAFRGGGSPLELSARAALSVRDNGFAPPARAASLPGVGDDDLLLSRRAIWSPFGADEWNTDSTSSGGCSWSP